MLPPIYVGDFGMAFVSYYLVGKISNPMRNLKIPVDGHEFELKYSIWSGREQLYCDGRLIADKRSFSFVTPYVFTVEEAGEAVVYEVNVLTSLSGSIGYVIRRNGIAVAHKP